MLIQSIVVAPVCGAVASSHQTVGVDPVLRANIWRYLVDLARDGVSVIVTTHYIEECRQAHCVGMMRDGRVLCEGPPAMLLSTTGEASLEAVFLSLCQAQHFRGGGSETAGADFELDAPRRTMSLSILNHLVGQTQATHALHARTRAKMRPVEGATDGEPVVQVDETVVTRPRVASHGGGAVGASGGSGCCGVRSSNVAALMWRGNKRLTRNWIALLFAFVLPAIQVLLFCVAVGRDPAQIPVAIINRDAGMIEAM
jgi:hypothetical protein